MWIEEIRAKTKEDLAKDLEDSYEELANLRFRWSTRQMTNVYEIKTAKKKIARILTVLRERELGVN
jgi:large subunit ribosomal protein L29